MFHHIYKFSQEIHQEYHQKVYYYYYSFKTKHQEKR